MFLGSFGPVLHMASGPGQILAANITHEVGSDASGTTSITKAATIPATCKMVIVFHHMVDNDTASATSDSCTVGGEATTALTARNGTQSNNMGLVKAYYKKNPLTGSQNIICNSSNVDTQNLTAVYIGVAVDYAVEYGQTFTGSTTSDDLAPTTTEALCLIEGFTKYNSEAIGISGGGTELHDTAVGSGQFTAAYLIQSAAGAASFARSWSTNSWGGHAAVGLIVL